MASAQDILQNLARDYALAWSSGNGQEVAAFFAADCEMRVNGGDPVQGQSAIANAVQGYVADFTEMELRCDLMRRAGKRAVFVWTLEGDHKDGAHVVMSGWDELELDNDNRLTSASGWYNEEDFQRQIART